MKKCFYKWCFKGFMCDNEVKIDSLVSRTNLDLLRIAICDSPVSRTHWSRDSPVSRTLWSHDSPVSRTNFDLLRKYDSPVSRTLRSRNSPVSRTPGSRDSPVSWTPGSRLKSRISPRKFVRIRNGPRASLMGPGGAVL